MNTEKPQKLSNELTIKMNWFQIHLKKNIQLTMKMKIVKTMIVFHITNLNNRFWYEDMC